MTRTFTILIAAAMVAAAFGLYQLAYEVQRLEDELTEINRGIVKDREAIQDLQAEWSYLTRPELVQERARLLEMKLQTPAQTVTIAGVPTLQDRVRVETAEAAKKGRPAQLQRAPAREPAPLPVERARFGVAQ